jgi:hypothetical protein
MAKTKKQAALNVLEPEGHAAFLEAARKRNLDGTRRDNAVRRATFQMEAIFKMVIACVGQARGEVPKWPNFDSELLLDVVRALAIRGEVLNSAVMNALYSGRDLSTEDLESLVYLGR